MEIFQKVISVLAFSLLGSSVAEVYLKVNQVWKRKHEPVVAESISVSGHLISLIGDSIFFTSLSSSQRVCWFYRLSIILWFDIILHTCRNVIMGAWRKKKRILEVNQTNS